MRLARAEDIGWDAFSDAILRPDRPDIDALSALVRQEVAARRRLALGSRGVKTLTASNVAWLLSDPSFVREVWESAVGRLDRDRFAGESDYDDGRRVFCPFVPLPRIEYGPERQCEPGDALRVFRGHPYDLETLVAFLSCDPAVVIETEEAALEAAERLRPWGVPGVRGVAWMLVRDTWPDNRYQDFRGIFGAPMLAAAWAERTLAAAERRTFAIDDEIRAAMGLPPVQNFEPNAYWFQPRTLPRVQAASFADSWMEWRACVRAGLAVPPNPYSFGYDPRLADRLFAELPDPIDPLMVVWGNGFVPIDVRWDRIVLGVSLPSDVKPFSGPTLTAVQREAQARYGRPR